MVDYNHHLSTSRQLNLFSNVYFVLITIHITFALIVKKFSAIFLIALFLFNLFGYRLLFNYEQQQSDKQLETSLDKQDYNEEDLLTIKVPLSLPYVNNQQNFERVDGELNVNGKILKYVKRKISDGHLILLCLPDHNKMRIESAKDEFFKYANDLAPNTQSKKPANSKAAVIKNLLVDFDAVTYKYARVYYSFIHSYNSETQLNFLPSSHQTLPEQPPETV